jgi:hypothetical protein
MEDAERLQYLPAVAFLEVESHLMKTKRIPALGHGCLDLVKKGNRVLKEYVLISFYF